MATSATFHKVSIEAFNAVYSNHKPSLTVGELQNLGLDAEQAERVKQVIKAAKWAQRTGAPITEGDFHNGLVSAMFQLQVLQKRPRSSTPEIKQPPLKKIRHDASLAQVFGQIDLCTEMLRQIGGKESLKMRLVCKGWDKIAVEQCIIPAWCHELEQKMAPYLATLGKTFKEYFAARGVNLSALSFKQACFHLMPHKKHNVAIGACHWIKNPNQDTLRCIEESVQSVYPAMEKVKDVAKKISEAPCLFLIRTSDSWSQRIEGQSKESNLREVILSEYSFMSFSEDGYFYYSISLLGFKTEDIVRSPAGLVLAVRSAIGKSFCFPIRNKLHEFTICPRETQEESFLPGFELSEDSQLVEIKINESYLRQIKGVPRDMLKEVVSSIYLPEFEFQRF
jgi:hypothetical protein